MGGLCSISGRPRRAPRSGDEWIERAAQRLTLAGHAERVVLETTTKPARDVEPVLGYYGWGGADPENRVRRVGMGFTPGAIAANLTSFDARTFKAPPDGWQPSGKTDKTTWWEGSSDTLIGDLIREGVTGVSGQVGEAFVLGAVRPEILFPAYLSGYNLAEAYYMATAALSWHLVVVGDPLAAPFARERLTREQLEEPVHTETELPGLFSRRRLAVAKRANSGLTDAAIAMVIRGETLLGRDDQAGAKGAFEKAIALVPKAVRCIWQWQNSKKRPRDLRRRDRTVSEGPRAPAREPCRSEQSRVRAGGAK